MQNRVVNEKNNRINSFWGTILYSGIHSALVVSYDGVQETLYIHLHYTLLMLPRATSSIPLATSSQGNKKREQRAQTTESVCQSGKRGKCDSKESRPEQRLKSRECRAGTRYQRAERENLIAFLRAKSIEVF